MKPFSRLFLRNTSLGLLGTLLFSSGVIFLLLWSWLFDLIIASMLVLKPNTYTLELWRKPPMPVALDFYFFNWTNPEKIHDHSQKPAFKEMGPYRFVEHREKVNFTWNANNTITYRQYRRWNFDEKNSVGKLYDNVTTLNAVTMSAAYHIKDWNYFLKRGFSHTVSAISPVVHISRSIGELLFDGYDDPFVNLAATFPFLANDMPQYDKFGWFYTRNNSYTFDGIFNMATGVNGTLGELKQWNYKNETTYFSDSCAKIHGSAAEFYPKNSQRDNIGFFSPDMCRHVQLDYEKDVVVKGIDGYKYSAQDSMLDNGTVIPENECFCNGQCIPSGMLNVSSCRYGTPAFVSLPHFYGADPIYTHMVEGLKPEKSKHELYITLEPKTGAALDVAVRLQLNMRISPIEHITLYRDIPELFFPMLWFEQVVSIPDDLSWGIWLFSNGSTICPIIASVLIITGILIMAYVTGQLIIETIRKRKQNMDRFYKEQIPLNQCSEESCNSIKRKLGYLDIIYS